MEKEEYSKILTKIFDREMHSNWGLREYMFKLIEKILNENCTKEQIQEYIRDALAFCRWVAQSFGLTQLLFFNTAVLKSYRQINFLSGKEDFLSSCVKFDLCVYCVSCVSNVCVYIERIGNLFFKKWVAQNTYFMQFQDIRIIDKIR